jgi:hypothetical protein
MLDEEKLVIRKFIQLGFKLNGPSEWTVLAGVVQHEEEEEEGIATTRWDDAAAAVKLYDSLIDCGSTNDHFNGGSVAGSMSSRAHHHHHHQCTTVRKSTDGGGGGVRYISKVVALGAGTTCMPSSTFTAASGLRYQYVRDSHAEVVARRAFKAYLLKQIEIAEEKEEEGSDGGGNHCESIFYTAPLSPGDGDGDGDGGEDMMNDDHHHYHLRKGVTFSMYISQAPCGHASMHCFLPRCDAVDDAGSVDGAVDDDPDAVDAARKKRKVDDVVVGRGHGDYSCQR